MAWWDETTRYIYESGVDDPAPEKPKNFWQKIKEAFFEEAVDALFFFLGVFTYLYMFAVAFLYLSGVSSFDTIASKIVRALAEPYLGAVGIYTILKESRKRRNISASKHWGEAFVIAWIALLVIASILAAVSPFYTFTKTLELIITLTLAVGLIYIGGAVHKP